ncbi:hypothetical protein ACS0TY_024304 [Phlomoides rotata]
MIRMILLWFTVGFASTSGAIAQFVFKDLYADRNSISSQLKEKFNSLNTRVSNLESAIMNQPISPQLSYYNVHPGSLVLISHRPVVAIYDKFAKAFSKAVESMEVGNGFGEGVVQGPLINDAPVHKVEFVQDAISKVCLFPLLNYSSNTMFLVKDQCRCLPVSNFCRHHY